MINSYLAKKLYLLAERIRGENIDIHLESLKRTQWLSPKDLEEIQMLKLTRIINHAYSHSPYYKKKLQDCGIRQTSIQGPSDMKGLPVLSKDNLREHFNSIKVSEGAYKFSLAKTSGSTGQALKFFKDRNASGNGRAAMYRGHSWYGLDVGAREAKLWGVPLNLKSRIATKLGDCVLNRFREENFYLSEKVLGSFYLNMRRYRPEYLMGYSSLVYEFAQFLKNTKLDASVFRLKMVKVTAETLFEYQRSLIEEVFQCPLAQEYGATEVGLVAFECPDHGIHITAEGVFIEEVDSDIPDLKEFLITDLDNFYSPIIRYRIGDYGLLSKSICRCGRGLPLLEKVVGRSSDIIYTKSGNTVHSSIFSYILKEITGSGGGIKQYKAYQRQKGQITVKIVKDSNFSDNTLNTLQRNIYSNIGADIEIEIEYVDHIEREKSGKLRYFVSELRTGQGQ